MSSAVHCDQCDTFLATNAEGQLDPTSASGWVHVRAAGSQFDFCTRACAVAFIEGPLVTTMEEFSVMITDHVRAMQEAMEDE